MLVNVQIMTALRNSYPLRTPISVLLHVQLVKLLHIWFQSNPHLGQPLAKTPRKEVLLRSYTQYTVLVEVARVACGSVYGREHSLYGDIASYA